MDYELKDSGTRRQFGEGSAWRDAAEGKGRYDLISPLALRRLAILFEKGAKKYDARNWEKGMPLSVFFDCAVRHLYKHLAGMRDEDHLAAAMWNVQAIMHFEEMIARGLKPAELNDLPSYEPPAEEPHDGLYHVEVLVPVDGDAPTWVEQGGGRDTQSLAQGAALWLQSKGMYERVRVTYAGKAILELVR